MDNALFIVNGIIMITMVVLFVYLKVFGGEEKLVEKERERLEDESFAKAKNKYGYTNEFYYELLNNSEYSKHPIFIEYRKVSRRRTTGKILLAILLIISLSISFVAIFVDFNAPAALMLSVLSSFIIYKFWKNSKDGKGDSHNHYLLELQRIYYENKSQGKESTSD